MIVWITRCWSDEEGVDCYEEGLVGHVLFDCSNYFLDSNFSFENRTKLAIAKIVIPCTVACFTAVGIRLVNTYCIDRRSCATGLSMKASFSVTEAGSRPISTRNTPIGMYIIPVVRSANFIGFFINDSRIKSPSSSMLSIVIPTRT